MERYRPTVGCLQGRVCLSSAARKTASDSDVHSVNVSGSKPRVGSKVCATPTITRSSEM